MDDIPRQDSEERRWQRRGDGEEKRGDCDKLVEKRLKFEWMTYRGRTVRTGGGKGEETERRRRGEEKRGEERRLINLLKRG